MIYFNGCSFTKGFELETKDIDCFPAVIAKKLDCEFYNDAKVGGSNARIQRATQNYLLAEKKKVSIIKENSCLGTSGITNKKIDLVVIMWTGINRIETMEETAWRTANWKRYILNTKTYLPHTGSHIAKEAEAEEKYYHYLNGYAKTISAMYNLKWTISYMLATKFLLEAHNIPYLFYTYSSKHFSPLLHLLDLDYTEYTNIEWPSCEINKKEVLNLLPFLKEKGFTELTEKLPIGKKNHPLEEAHIKMADIIIGDIEKYEYDKEFD